MNDDLVHPLVIPTMLALASPLSVGLLALKHRSAATPTDGFRRKHVNFDGLATVDGTAGSDATADCFLSTACHRRKRISEGRIVSHS